MSPPLTLVRLKPDMAALAGWGVARGYLLRGVDAGYCLHAATRAVLGELAPRPFVLRERRGQDAELLGYVARPADEVKAVAVLPALHDEDAALALGLATLDARAMPTDWPAGRRLGFHLRARPVARPRAGRESAEGEVDVALWARRGEPDVGPEDAYLSWLAARLHPGARVLQARVEARRSVLVLRRPETADGRISRRLPGPDVSFKGVLEVADPGRFGDLLAQGVGRHRAFGFGCLLLAPPGVM